MQKTTYIILCKSISFFFLLTITPIHAQNDIFGLDDPRAQLEPDACEHDPTLAKQLLEILGPGFGYNYDSLYADLERWQQSPFVQIDSVGASVQNRTLWNLTIIDTATFTSPKYRISIHARTHPQEVQSSWVTNEMIKIILGDTELSRILRANCIFNIIPMYNPDGVELGYNRENANGVDLESNWSTYPHQPEVAILKKQFEFYMQTNLPIRIALNMHSSNRGNRYFVYHHENGTSTAYAEDEKNFIGSIKNHWPEGISDWDDFVSWTNGTPNYYPESWYWINHGEAVMALTYEDVYGETEYGFDLAANTILSGIADYLDLSPQTSIADKAPLQNANTTASLNVFPNPVSQNSVATIQLTTIKNTAVNLTLYDILGRRIKNLTSGNTKSGTSNWQLSTCDLASGFYFLSLNNGNTVLTIPLTIRH